MTCVCRFKARVTLIYFQLSSASQDCQQNCAKLSRVTVKKTFFTFHHLSFYKMQFALNTSIKIISILLCILRKEKLTIQLFPKGTMEGGCVKEDGKEPF